MTSSGRPLFFCSRPNGSLTPLIAIDELPSTVSIRGVSRNLTPGDTQGMTSCGVATARYDPWTVEGVSHQPSTAGATAAPSEPSSNAMTELHDILLKILTDNNVPSHYRDSVQKILNQCNGRLSLSGPNGHALGMGRSGFKKKLYCSYWIRHGECDYQQQGCMYKHDMPLDLVTLDKLGLRDIPRWFREKYGHASLLGYQSRANHPHQQHITAQPASQPMQPSGGGPGPRAISYIGRSPVTQGGNMTTPASTSITNDVSNLPIRGSRNDHGNSLNVYPNRATNNRYKPRGPGRNRGNSAWCGKNNHQGISNDKKVNNGSNRISPSSRSDSYESYPENNSVNSNVDRTLSNESNVVSTPSVASVDPFTPNSARSALIPHPGSKNSNALTERSTALRAGLSFSSHDPIPSNQGLFKGRQDNNEATGRRRSEDLAARLTALDAPSSNDNTKGASLPSLDDTFIRKKSRCPYKFGLDGDSQKAPKAGPVTGHLLDTSDNLTDSKGTSDAAQTKQDDLCKNTQPVRAADLLLNFGPVGERVQIPPVRQCYKTGAYLGLQQDYMPIPRVSSNYPCQIPSTIVWHTPKPFNQ